jgi:hypothetical protein
MDFERLDSFPEFNLFFSPNWFSHQIADISPSGLCAFGCNDEVQLIDLFARRPITSLYIKTPNNDKILKDINERKVTAVLVTDQFIVFTTISGFLTIFEISKNNIICRFCDQVLQSVQISAIKELRPDGCELELLLTDLKNKIIFAKYKAGVLDQINLERQGNNHSTKFLEIINYKDQEQFYAKIMDNGSFNIWTAYFEESVYHVDIGHIVNTATFGIFDNLLIITLLSRKNRLIVCQVGLEKIFEDFTKDRKFVHTNGNNFRLLVNLELEVTSDPLAGTEVFDKVKLRFHNRVVALNDQRIIITGKDGKMYLTDIESLMKIKEDKLVIKPADEEVDNPHYEMLDENPHFKNIYFSKLVNNFFVSIGMDRLICFWTVSRHKVQYEFNIKCLGSKVTKTAISPLEPQSFLLACNDSTLRFMNTGHKSNRFFTTLLWKNLERKVFRDMKFHPTEFGLVSIVTERQISLMDVHAHVVLSEFTINELGDGDILFARWLKRSIVEVFVDSRFEKEVIKVVQANRAYKPDNARPSTKVNSKFQVVHKKYNRELDKNYMLVVYVQNRGFFVVDFNLGTVFALQYRIEKFVSAVEVVNLMDECKTIVFIFGDKKGKLIIVRAIDGKYDGAFIDGIHQGTVTTIKVNEGRLPIVRKGIAGPPKPDAESSPGKRLIFTDEDRHLDSANREEQLRLEKENRTFLESNKVQVKMDSGDIMVATGSLDRTIKILIIRRILKPEKFHYKNVHVFLGLRHRYRISDIDWDPFDPDRFLNVCQKHVTVQVWTINPTSDHPHKNSDDKGPRDDADIDKYYVSNIRGHKGFVTSASWSHNEKNCILTCSDDQSIKVWNLINIRSRQPPMPMRREAGEDEGGQEEDDGRREEDNFRDDFGQRNGQSKLESYKQGVDTKKAVNYRVDSDDEEDYEASQTYFNQSK